MNFHECPGVTIKTVRSLFIIVLVLVFVIVCGAYRTVRRRRGWSDRLRKTRRRGSGGSRWAA